MEAAMYGPDHSLIENLDQTVEDYFASKALKNFKLISKTKKWNISRNELPPNDDSDSDEAIDANFYAYAVNPREIWSLKWANLNG